MMKPYLVCVASLLLVVSLQGAEPPLYQPVERWLTPPPGQDTIGQAHGDIAVSSSGEVYVSVEKGPNPGLQVYSPEGKYLRNVPNAPADFHGFVIRGGPEGEFLYGARVGGQMILKMTLDGKVVLEIPASAIPSEMKVQFNGQPRVLLTGLDVAPAPDGRIFVVDGYASDYIHVFDPNGKYLTSFGGKKEPYGFKTNHKIAIDTRFTPARILCCDRENRRVVFLSLDGQVLSVVEDIKRPAAAAIFGDFAAVAEIEGRITMLDKEGRPAATVGDNDVKEQTATNQVKPADWRTGVLTAPHGLAFDKAGNLYVTEFNLYGRVLRYNRTRR